jgi:hypothetical protein
VRLLIALEEEKAFNVVDPFVSPFKRRASMLSLALLSDGELIKWRVDAEQRGMER